MARTNQGDYKPARLGEPSHPQERFAAVLKDIKWQPYPSPEVTIVAVQCRRCGQGLVDLLRIPQSLLYPLNPLNPPSLLFRPPDVASRNGLYIERTEVHGWMWDGNTLRPTRYHLAQQQRARKEVWGKPQTETKRTRQSLAHHSRHSSGRYFTRPLSKQGDPWRRTETGIVFEQAPESVECPQCHADIRVVPTMTAHDDVM
jgi:rubredoxin